jgi:hypothetical protein
MTRGTSQLTNGTCHQRGSFYDADSISGYIGSTVGRVVNNELEKIGKEFAVT